MVSEADFNSSLDKVMDFTADQYERFFLELNDHFANLQNKKIYSDRIAWRLMQAHQLMKHRVKQPNENTTPCSELF